MAMGSDLEKQGFWLRTWNSKDMANLFWLASMHVLGACAPFVEFEWGAVWVALVLAILTGLGVTMGYHRLLTHRSFKAPKWFEYFIAYCGAHSIQRDPIFWVTVHKHHHKNADTYRDPHTPTQGFWFSHMGWIIHTNYLASKLGESRTGAGEYSNVKELKAQRFYRFLHHTYFWHPTALAALLYLYGGFPYLAWAMGVRVAVVLHSAFLVNSACHIWGARPWNTPDTSTNNWWLAPFTLGESWHNNHHAFPKSARHGLEWWQLDITWQLIKLLRLIGLVTDVKCPSEEDKRRISQFQINKLK